MSDSHTKLIAAIGAKIDTALPGIDSYLEQSNPIVIPKFEARRVFITHADKVVDYLAVQVKQIREKIEHIRGIHEAERNILRNLADNRPNTEVAQPTQAWTTVGKKRPIATTPQLKRTPVPINGSIQINAVRVPEFAQVQQDGELYYVESAGHFAVYIGGQLFHGNMGNIIVDDAPRRRTTDCKYIKGCNNSACEYYHDPLLFTKSNDVRNYHTSQFHYRPANSEKRTGGRSFGSHDNLSADIAAESPADISMRRDLAMHEILCALILSKYVK